MTKILTFSFFPEFPELLTCLNLGEAKTISALGICSNKFHSHQGKRRNQ